MKNAKIFSLAFAALSSICFLSGMAILTKK